MMKIVEVVHGFPPEVIGGTERHVQGITEGLRDRGHDLHVYSGSLEWMENFTVELLDRDGYELATVHRNDLYFDRWDKAYNPLVEENFRNYLSERKPDLIHVHHWVRLTSNLIAIAAEAGIPVVVTLHDLYVTCPRFFRMKDDGTLCDLPLSTENCLHSAERWLFQRDAEIRCALAFFKDEILNELKCATRLLAPSAHHAAAVRRHLGLGDIRIDVLPHGSLTQLKPAPGSPEGSKVRIVYFSHLYPFKGAGLLIEAFQKMQHQNEAELHLFGAEVIPDFAKKLKTLAKGSDVTFHGAYVPKDLESFPMDLVVIPTLLSESYSFILDEAAGLRVPVLAADAGAIPERAGGSVQLFRTGDADDLASAMDRLVSDRSRLKTMRSAEPVKVLSLNEHLDRLEAVYREAASAETRAVEDDRIRHRLKDQWERREYGFKELIRSEQWEILVASLRKRIVELEVEIAKRPVE
jgi:glycosyltransferase involved in cell wall biosynthesis